ncbi:phosphate ABC transporter permease PstA [Lyngbya sp. PCC 8106]|uniref:phosphate ABC transporter permease PstA n=1 Tax=Lyngbya sp. (strain PCC 8106) TaxID=313612 RepID=UPI0000EACE1E|nr:phosphate ABC transporter permease PstA [Lyngbya sp. PCC 8106]EAW34768.1 Phosphate transport system permease protein 2 [Lyngbya sp. PCC 8106]
MTSGTTTQQNGFPNESIETSGSNSGNLIEKLLTGLAFFMLGLAILPLGLVISYVIFKGLSRFNLALFTEIPPTAMQAGGGVASAIAGTILLVGIAVVISVPIGIGAGIYLSEFSSKKIAKWIRFATNVLSGVPSIVVGIFAYTVVVLTMDKFSTLAGGFALAILMLPIIVRTTDEALQLVPQDVRWASVGVGASSFHTVLQIVVPAAIPAILTGITLAVARAAGETAPLLFTVIFAQSWPDGIIDQTVPSMSVLIYNFATAPYENQQEIAWAASLILILLVLFASVLARYFGQKGTY